MSKFCLLIVDDDQDFTEVVKGDIGDQEFTLISASTAEEAKKIITEKSDCIALILCDYQLGPTTGFELRKSVLEQTRNIPFIIISGIVSRDIALSAIELKIAAFLEKPYASDTLKALIAKEAKFRLESLKEEQEIQDAFTKDAELLLEESENIILALESNPEDLDSLDRLCAIVHTIKGSSGFFQPPTINKFAHRYEDFIVPFKKREAKLSAATVSILLKGIDTLKILVKALIDGKLREYSLDSLIAFLNEKPTGQEPTDLPTPHVQAAPKVQGHSPQNRDDIRVSIKVLDEFMELSGELTVMRNMLYKVVQTVERELPGNRNIAQLSELFGELHHINSQIQDKILDLRKVPLQNILRPLQRTIRDLAQSLGKPINLEIEGGELRVDTALAEVLSNSMIHMVRNSADHGIESPELRSQRKKPKVGTLKLSAFEELDQIVVKLSDDGNGIDPEIIRKKIVEKELRTNEQAQRMSVAELQNMIFEPGFSTAKQVTDVSGRGVGMDMVKKSIVKVGGSTKIESTPGEGTAITLHLPIPKTVLIIASLLVRVRERLYAIPQDKITRLISIPPSSRADLLRPVEGGCCLNLDGEILPLISVDRFLNPQPNQSAFFQLQTPNEEVKIIVVSGKNSQFGLVVSEIFDLEDTVVKKLGSHLQTQDIYLGATYLGDGAIGLALNVEGIESSLGLGANHRLAAPVDSANLLESASSPAKDLILFELGDRAVYGVYLNDIFRIEEILQTQIQRQDSLPVTIYRDSVMPLFCLRSLLDTEKNSLLKEERRATAALIVQKGERFLGLCVDSISDLITTQVNVDAGFSNPRGILGTSIVNNQAVTLLDLEKVLNVAESLQICEGAA